MAPCYRAVKAQLPSMGKRVVLHLQLTRSRCRLIVRWNDTISLLSIAATLRYLFTPFRASVAQGKLSSLARLHSVSSDERKSPDPLCQAPLMNEAWPQQR